jgi:hypothetical protein
VNSTSDVSAASAVIVEDDTVTPVADTRIISKPALAEQVQRLETEALSSAENETPPMAGVLKTIQEALKVLGEKLSALTMLGKILLAAILVIPFIFLLTKRLLQKQPEETPQQWQEHQRERATPAAIYDDRPSTEAIKARWDDDFLDEADDTQRTEPLPPMDDLPTRRDEPIERHEGSADETTTRYVPKPSPENTATTLTSRWQSGFGSWLEKEPTEFRQQYCTEFLIYWMAYGDERYEKSLKKAVFVAQDPDQHLLIKRWVLKQDTFAFADAVRWIKTNTSKMQQEQLLDLLMALLVTETNITPNQNIMLRMLADTLGIGSDALKERFLFTFSEDLPPFPRPDKQNWWLEHCHNLSK